MSVSLQCKKCDTGKELEKSIKEIGTVKSFHSLKFRKLTIRLQANLQICTNCPVWKIK